MARGKYYTEEEDRALLNLYKDNKNKKLVEIANLAKSYNLCATRSRDALAQHISMLINPPEEEFDGQISMEEMESDLELNAAKADVKLYKDKYLGLLVTILGTAEMFESGGLKLNYWEIIKWLRKNEPVLLGDCIDELKAKE